MSEAITPDPARYIFVRDLARQWHVTEPVVRRLLRLEAIKFVRVGHRIWVDRQSAAEFRALQLAARQHKRECRRAAQLRKLERVQRWLDERRSILVR